MNQLDPFIEKIHLAYENDPTFYALIKSTPLTDYFHRFIADRVKEIRYERNQTFFRELKRGKVKLTPEIIESEDFLHKFFISYDVAINTRRRKKISYFARLLKSSLQKNIIHDCDAYEEYLKILEDLSYREIKSLVLLDNFYQKPRYQEENDFMTAQNFWDTFEKQIVRKINIPSDLTGDFMNRISRTGCYELFKGIYPSVDTSKGMGSLTNTFQFLKEFTLDEGE